MSIGVVVICLCLLPYSFSRIPLREIPTRIPPEIKPVDYDLLIHPHLREGTFSGSVSVQFELKSPINFIPIHQHGLNILRSVITGIKGKVHVKESYKIKSYDYWLIEPTVRPIEAGTYNLTIIFSGNMKNKINGLYRSVYTSPMSLTPTYLATTKFEPFYARYSFPCFDEPLLKAKFKIRVIHPKEPGYHALGNTDIVSETTGPAGDEVVVEYRETPPVSTYLIAYVVSNFKTLGPVTIGNPGGTNFSLQVWSAPHLVRQTAFARHIGQQCLSYFMKYFDIPYPLMKMDFVAIPDFPSGAMENWGLVTFRETEILSSENCGMLAVQDRVAHVTAHELAHQWFGNLVTMKWWSDIWLNEGFARFMQFKGVLEGTLEGAKWKGEIQSMEDVIITVLAKDAMFSTHAVINKASSPGAINEVFDVISYGKGASILNMVEHLLGKDVFMNGIRNYLKAHQFGNAESADLWTVLGEVSGLSLHATMDTWLTQPGFPLLTVHRTRKTTHITQERFLSDKEKIFSPDSPPSESKWDVPIMFRTAQSEQQQVAWLYSNMSELVLQQGRSSPWLKLNYKFSGFFRVNYDMATWEAIIQQLCENHTIFTPEDRANLLDDAFALANGGYLPFSVPLDMVRVYFKKESARLPLLTGLQRLSALSGKIQEPLKTKLKLFERDIVTALYDNILGHYEWDFSRTQVTREIEVDLMTYACRNMLRQCTKPARRFFKLFMNNGTRIVPEFQLLVYSTGTVSGKEEVMKHMFRKLNECFDPKECKNVLTSLMASGNEKYISKLLKLSLDDQVVRRQDFFTALSQAASSNRALTWNFYRSHYKQMVNKFGLQDRSLRSSIMSVASKFGSKERLAEVKEFLKKHNGSSQENGRKFVMENIKDNIQWKKRADGVKKYFKNLKKMSDREMTN